MPASPRRVIGFINVAHFTDHWLMLIFPTAVLGMGGEFGLAYGDLIALSLPGFLAFGAGALPAGWLGDRCSRRGMLAVFFIGIGFASIVTGLATTALELAAGLAAIGLFGSIYHPVGTAMLVGHAERAGRAIGVNGVWGNLGVASAALVTGAITEWLNWRFAFLLPGGLAALTGALFLRLVPPEADRRVGPREARARAVPRATVRRAFAVLALVTLSGGVVFNAVAITLPKLVAERLPQIPGAFGVGLLVFFVYAIGASSQLVVGRVIDRHSLKTCFVPVALCQGPLLGLAAVLHGWALLPVAIGMVFVIFAQVTINDGVVAQYAAADWRSRVYALRYVLSFGASACAVPLVATTHDLGGFRLLFTVLACFALLTLAGAILFPSRRGDTVFRDKVVDTAATANGPRFWRRAEPKC